MDVEHIETAENAARSVVEGEVVPDTIFEKADPPP
jgi:hypothetical protein